MKKPWKINICRKNRGCEWGRGTKEREVWGEDILGIIWWCHGKVSERVFRIYGCFRSANCERQEQEEETPTRVSCPPSVETCELLHQTQTHLRVRCQTPLIPVLASLEQLMWLDLVPLFSIISSLLFVYQESSTDRAPFTRWKWKTAGNLWQAPWPVVVERDQ